MYTVVSTAIVKLCVALIDRFGGLDVARREIVRRTPWTDNLQDPIVYGILMREGRDMRTRLEEILPAGVDPGALVAENADKIVTVKRLSWSIGSFCHENKIVKLGDYSSPIIDQIYYTMIADGQRDRLDEILAIMIE